MKIISKEMRMLLSNCYFSTDHCSWLRFRHLDLGDRQIYLSSKEYGELRKLKARWAQLSAIPHEFEDLVGDLDFRKANLMFWEDASFYASSHTIGVVSEFLEVLRLDTQKFNQDRKVGRRLVFQKIKEITGQMDAK